MVFLPAMGIFTFFFWMKEIRERFVGAMLILLAVAPTIAILLWQSLYFQSVTQNKAAFLLGGFSHFTLEEVIKVCIATFPVPLVGLIFYWKDIIRSKELQIVYIALGFGIIEMFMFTNGPTGDFSWGYDLAVGLSTMVVLGKSIISKEKRNALRSIPLFVLFSRQVAVGVFYVLTIYIIGGETWF